MTKNELINIIIDSMNKTPSDWRIDDGNFLDHKNTKLSLDIYAHPLPFAIRIALPNGISINGWDKLRLIFPIWKAKRNFKKKKIKETMKQVQEIIDSLVTDGLIK